MAGVRTVVVYVHGLWMTGMEGTLLRWRLGRQLSAATPLFAYPSIGAGMSANARSLARRLARLSADTLHLVGHSLGGLVICKMFEDIQNLGLPPGRVVLLGSPLAGSRAARALDEWKIGRFVMGRSVCEELLIDRDRRWTHGRDLGVIAGTLNAGLGRIVNTHRGLSDGTIYVDETEIPGVKEQLVMRVSHVAMPFSAAVATQTAAFLRDGRFKLDAAQGP